MEKDNKKYGDSNGIVDKLDKTEGCMFEFLSHHTTHDNCRYKVNTIKMPMNRGGAITVNTIDAKEFLSGYAFEAILAPKDGIKSTSMYSFIKNVVTPEESKNHPRKILLLISADVLKDASYTILEDSMVDTRIVPPITDDMEDKVVTTFALGYDVESSKIYILTLSPNSVMVYTGKDTAPHAMGWEAKTLDVYHLRLLSAIIDINVKLTSDLDLCLSNMFLKTIQNFSNDVTNKFKSGELIIRGISSSDFLNTSVVNFEQPPFDKCETIRLVDKGASEVVDVDHCEKSLSYLVNSRVYEKILKQNAEEDITVNITIMEPYKDDVDILPSTLLFYRIGYLEENHYGAIDTTGSFDTDAVTLLDETTNFRLGGLKLVKFKFISSDIFTNEPGAFDILHDAMTPSSKATENNDIVPTIHLKVSGKVELAEFNDVKEFLTRIISGAMYKRISAERVTDELVVSASFLDKSLIPDEFKSEFTNIHFYRIETLGEVGYGMIDSNAPISKTNPVIIHESDTYRLFDKTFKFTFVDNGATRVLDMYIFRELAQMMNFKYNNDNLKTDDVPPSSDDIHIPANDIMLIRYNVSASYHSDFIHSLGYILFPDSKAGVPLEFQKHSFETVHSDGSYNLFLLTKGGTPIHITVSPTVELSTENITANTILGMMRAELVRYTIDTCAITKARKDATLPIIAGRLNNCITVDYHTDKLDRLKTHSVTDFADHCLNDLIHLDTSYLNATKWAQAEGISNRICRGSVSINILNSIPTFIEVTYHDGISTFNITKSAEDGELQCEAYLSLRRQSKTITLDKTPSDVTLADIYTAFVKDNGDDWLW